MLPGPSGTSPEMVEVARRERVALLAGASGHSLSDTVLGLSAAVRADPGLLLRRTREAIDGLGAMEGAGEDDILRAASASVGVAYRASGLAAPGANATVIRIGGRPDGYVCWDGEDPAAAIVAQVVATTLGRVRAAAREAEAARERALLALLGARDGGAAARRARHAGVPVEGWHVAVFLRDPAASSAPSASSASSVSSAPAASVVADAVLREARAAAGAALPGHLGLGEAADLAAPPLVTRWQDGVLVVLTTDERTTARAPAGRPAGIDTGIDTGIETGLGAGVGTCQAGPDGLRRTVSQARAAAARAEAGQTVAFDRLGVHALLAELGGSESALMAARDLLAPLERLGALSAHAVPTLKAYLDCWGSRTRAAELLSLHPNAVAHRIRRIAETLDADLSDPQTRFALQLACHVVLDHDCLPGTTTPITSS